MEKGPRTLLWRVEWLHRRGYYAPTYWVEAPKGNTRGKSRRNAIIAASECSRLGDFPENWFCKITDVTDYSEE
jgi:hypothetical protein